MGRTGSRGEIGICFSALHFPYSHQSLVSKWGETEFGSEVVTAALCPLALRVPED